MAVNPNGTPPVRPVITGADFAYLSTMSNLYSILVSLNFLEVAFASGTIESQDYASECRKLLQQHHMAMPILTRGEDEERYLDRFTTTWNIDGLTYARNRIRTGEPQGTNVEPTVQRKPLVPPEVVMDVTKAILTAKDAVNVGQLDKQALHPVLATIAKLIKRFKVFPDSDGNFASLKRWLIKLNRLSGDLTHEEGQQLHADLDDLEHAFRLAAMGS
ncbi:hypothetical protein M427DRAFT_60503 [Gonapodya prolifera JEL478]|uniref:Vacuolar protein sorting-associated protein 28 n=1 Tax=Gonapodya prolifera (strain JEL478) TaxID=1344416 RepID=A0A139A571_GONPJ|nr:hypothetical protein M427DRAFT_60503 [Gonapodya prolifera JEL478]|eukprot:KXS11645.1 hypothetical protein M427DRAFT_60503 [Gonapodya prolifera JEL478]